MKHQVTITALLLLALLLISCKKKPATQANPPAQPDTPAFSETAQPHSTESESKTFTGRIHNYTMWGPPGYGANRDTDPIEHVLLFMPDDKSKSMVLVFASAKESERLHEWDKVRVCGVPYEIQTDILHTTKFLPVESVELLGRDEHGKTIQLKDGKRTVSFHQADYDRDDLLYIMGTSSDSDGNTSLISVWKIEAETLSAQKSFTEAKLRKHIVSEQKIVFLTSFFCFVFVSIASAHNAEFRGENYRIFWQFSLGFFLACVFAVPNGRIERKGVQGHCPLHFTPRFCAFTCGVVRLSD